MSSQCLPVQPISLGEFMKRSSGTIPSRGNRSTFFCSAAGQESVENRKPTHNDSVSVKAIARTSSPAANSLFKTSSGYETGGDELAVAFTRGSELEVAYKFAAKEIRMEKAKASLHWGQLSLMKSTEGVVAADSIRDVRPKKVVVTESEFVRCIEKIVSRDYFPDLEMLRLVRRMLSAEQVGDIGTAKQLAQRIDLLTPATPVDQMMPSRQRRLFNDYLKVKQEAKGEANFCHETHDATSEEIQLEDGSNCREAETGDFSVEDLGVTEEEGLILKQIQERAWKNRDSGSTCGLLDGKRVFVDLDVGIDAFMNTVRSEDMECFSILQNEASARVREKREWMAETVEKHNNRMFNMYSDTLGGKSRNGELAVNFLCTKSRLFFHSNELEDELHAPTAPSTIRGEVMRHNTRLPSHLLQVDDAALARKTKRFKQHTQTFISSWKNADPSIDALTMETRGRIQEFNASESEQSNAGIVCTSELLNRATAGISSVVAFRIPDPVPRQKAAAFLQQKSAGKKQKQQQKWHNVATGTSGLITPFSSDGRNVGSSKSNNLRTAWLMQSPLAISLASRRADLERISSLGLNSRSRANSAASLKSHQSFK